MEATHTIMLNDGEIESSCARQFIWAGLVSSSEVPQVHCKLSIGIEAGLINAKGRQ